MVLVNKYGIYTSFVFFLYFVIVCELLSVGEYIHMVFFLCLFCSVSH